MAIGALTGAFTGTGQSGAIALRERFNLSLWGTFGATVQLERSFDGGATWLAAARNGDGDPAQYAAPVSLVCEEPEAGVLYRLNCTAHSSGTVNYRVSQ